MSHLLTPSGGQTDPGSAGGIMVVGRHSQQEGVFMYIDKLLGRPRSLRILRRQFLAECNEPPQAQPAAPEPVNPPIAQPEDRLPNGELITLPFVFNGDL